MATVKIFLQRTQMAAQLSSSRIKTDAPLLKT